MLRLPDGCQVQIPTLEEALRVKAYLVIQRNQVRDYLDVAALADRMGIRSAAVVLTDIGRYYDDRSEVEESVASEVAVKLASPDPRDQRTIAELPRYKGIIARWQDWGEVRRVCAELAQQMIGGPTDE